MRKIALIAALLCSVSFAGRVWSATPAPFVAPDGSFQMHYASNLNLGDSVINLSNAGSAYSLTNTSGDICENLYAFSPDEQMISCCSCRVTPDGLNSFSIRNDIISNTLTGVMPTSVVVKLVGSAPSKKGCDPSSVNSTNLTSGMVAWGTTLHLTPVAGAVDLTEEEFTSPVLSATELGNLASQCGFILNHGSGFGICRGCRAGGL